MAILGTRNLPARAAYLSQRNKMDSLHDLYDRYAADVYRFALYLSGDPTDAEDITADTFVRLWSATGEIRLPSVKAYLLTIARHLYVDGQRARARFTELDPELASGERSVEDRTAARSQMQFLLKSMRQLAEGDRAALLMRTGGLPYDEIALSLGISVNAAKVRVHRARKRLMGAQSTQETRS